MAENEGESRDTKEIEQCCASLLKDGVRGLTERARRRTKSFFESFCQGWSGKKKCYTAVWVTLTIVALLVATVPFFLDDADKHPWIVRLLAPRYAPAIAAYETMLNNLGSPMQPDDPGFSDIASVLSVRLPIPSDLAITSITINERAIISISAGHGIGPRVAGKIGFSTGKQASWEAYGLPSQIREEFLEAPLRRASFKILWIVTLVEFMAMAFELMRERAS